MKLSFTSLSTPEWTVDRIVELAKDLDYDGVELRCDYGHKHGISVGFRDTPKSTPEQASNVLKMLQDAGVEICLLGTSAAFSSADSRERERNIQEAKEYVVLANRLDCPMVRVFGGRLSEGVEKAVAAEYIAQSLSEIGRFAEDYGVLPVIEQHDVWRQALDLAMIVEKANVDNLGVNWHLTRENAEPLKLLGARLKHTHIRESGPFLLEILRVLKSMGYEGYLSFEGGRGQNPEAVLKEHIARMKKYLSQL